MTKLLTLIAFLVLFPSWARAELTKDEKAFAERLAARVGPCDLIWMERGGKVEIFKDRAEKGESQKLKAGQEDAINFRKKSFLGSYSYQTYHIENNKISIFITPGNKIVSLAVEDVAEAIRSALEKRKQD